MYDNKQTSWIIEQFLLFSSFLFSSTLCSFNANLQSKPFSKKQEDLSPFCSKDNSTDTVFWSVLIRLKCVLSLKNISLFSRHIIVYHHIITQMCVGLFRFAVYMWRKKHYFYLSISIVLNNKFHISIPTYHHHHYE